VCPQPALCVLALIWVFLCRCFATRQITEALLRKNYHDKLPHQIPAAVAAQDVLRSYYRKAKKRLAAENDQDAGSAADADGAGDRDDEDDGEDAEDEHVAAAKGQAALTAASEAASDGITGDTSAQHMMQLLAMLPDSQRAAEDAAAAGGRGRQQDEKWAKLNQNLSKVLAHAAAGKTPQYRRGDDRHQAVCVEVAALQQSGELSGVAHQSLNNRTWEVSKDPCRGICGGLELPGNAACLTL